MLLYDSKNLECSQHRDNKYILTLSSGNKIHFGSSWCTGFT